MRRIALALAFTTGLILLALALTAALAGYSHAFTVSGRFLYEDRLFDGNGYTGAVQNLPIRRAQVEVVNAITMQTLATGATDGTGAYALTVSGEALPLNLYVRCTTDGRTHNPPYEIRVVDNFVRNFVLGELVLTGSVLYSITTTTVLAHPPADDLDMGAFLIQDTDGTGVAQAFHIFDNGVDFFDWLAQPAMLGRLPSADEFIVYAWKATGTPGNPPPAFGSNYSLQGVFIGATPNMDTDGWSDTVILHETGHWLDDVYLATDNVGGEHFIGDNDANVLLAYGEGAATYHCAKVREFRAARLNDLGQPVDHLVSLYADLEIPPPVGTPGALSFGYDFETGNFSDTGVPIGQIGSANETNVTSALWDLLDGPSSPDATPGADDDPVEVGDGVAWDIERNYLHTLPAAEDVTVEDYYQGWFARNGAGFMQSGLDVVFVTLARMPFHADAFEPDNAVAGAGSVAPTPYALAAGRVVINEIELGSADGVELYNGSPAPVDLGGWQIEVYANGITNDATRIYTFAPMTLNPGETVALHEGGSPTANGRHHVYGGDRTVFNASWNAGIDGAVVLRDASATPVDFVRWRGVDDNGVPYENATPAPAGLSFTGSLDTPAPPRTMARDVSGTDTDSAADFAAHDGSLGSVNHPAPQLHTIFGVGDQDVIAFAATPDTRYGFEVRGPYHGTDPFLELLDPTGQPIGANDDMDGPVRDARLDFYATEAGTYYLRVTHVGMHTDWAEYSLLAFVRPVNAVFVPPSGLVATASNISDEGDAVDLRWTNAGAYDSVRVYRDGARVATLAGAPGQFTDYSPRGLHRYEVAGMLAGAETSRTGDDEFAGVVHCYAADDFESGGAGLWLRTGTTWDITPMAASGSFGFTDSPAGTYQGCPDPLVRPCPVNAVALFSVPSRLTTGTMLRWDQICITEHCEGTPCDVCIVEVSADDGATWTEVARYDQASDPAWTDNVADPTDWRPAFVELGAWAGRQILVRFRLQSDQLLELDGWYVDNLRVSTSSCEAVAVGDGPLPRALEMLPPFPNPARGAVELRYLLPSKAERVDLSIHDVHGRLVWMERLGPRAAGAHAARWNGRDAGGRDVASGMYYAKLRIDGTSLTRKVLRLAP